MKTIIETIINADATNQEAEVSQAFQMACQAVIAGEKVVGLAINKLRASSLHATALLGWSPEDLTKKLKEQMIDPARASEICGFVFPKTGANKKILLEMVAFNEGNPNARQWTKQEILAVQRAKDATTAIKERELLEEKARLDALPKTPSTTTTSTKPAVSTLLGDITTTNAKPLSPSEKEAEEKRIALRLQTNLHELLKAYALAQYGEVDFFAELAQVLITTTPFAEKEDEEEVAEEVNAKTEEICNTLAKAMEAGINKKREDAKEKKKLAKAHALAKANAEGTTLN